MKLLIRLVIGFVIILVLSIGVITITLINFDPNNYKETIAAKVKEQTGRSLSINGDIDLTFYPWLGINVKGVSLSNAANFGDIPFLETKTIKARAKLLPLLRKELEMDTLVLHGARFNLARDTKGVNNWDDLVNSEDKKQGTNQNLPFAALILGGIDVKDASIRWRDMQQGVEYNITNTNIHTGELKLGEPIDIIASSKVVASKPAISASIQFKGTLSYEDNGDILILQPMSLEAVVSGKEIPGGKTSLKLSSEIKINFDKDTADINSLYLTAFDTKIKGQTKVSNLLSGNPEFTSKISISGEDLPQLFKIAEIEPLASELGKLSNKKFNLNASLNTDLENKNLKIDELVLNIFGNKVNAEIYARNLRSDAPAARGKLNASGPDLPSMIKIAHQFSGAPKKEINSLAKQLASSPKLFNIESIFDIDLKAGIADIPRLSIKALGMSTSAKLKAKKINSATPILNGELEASGPDLPLIMQIVHSMQKANSDSLKLSKNLGKVKSKSFNIKTSFDTDLSSGKIDLPSLSIDTLGVSISGNLKGKNIQKNSGSMKGSVSIISKNPKPLLIALGQTDIAEVLKSIDINTDISGNSSNIKLKPLSLAAVFSGKNIPNSPVKLKVRADSKINLEKEIIDLDSLRVSGLGLDVKGKIKASKFKTNPVYTGQVTIAPFDLKKFLKTLNKEIPSTSDKDALKNIAVKTDFSGEKNKLSLKNVNAELDETKLQGDINIKSFTPLAVEFGVGIDKLNIDHYLPKQEKSKPVTPETVAVGVATSVPTQKLQKLKIKGDLAIGQLVISNAKLSDIALSVNTKEGVVELNPVMAKLYQGTYSGNVVLNMKDKTPSLIVQSKLAGVQTEPLLIDVMGAADLLGEANINLSLNSTGLDVGRLKGSLSGSGEIAFKDGTLKGVDIANALKQIEIMYESKRFGDVETTGDTQFKSLTATLKIKNGVVDNNDLLLSATGFKVNGKGMLINLNDETWKYNMNVVVDNSTATKDENRYNIGGYNILIKCRGKVINKRCLPDLGSMIEAIFKETTKEKLLDKIGIKIPGLTTKEEAPKQKAPKQEAPKQEAPKQEAPKEKQQTKSKDPLDELKDAVIEDLFEKLF